MTWRYELLAKTADASVVPEGVAHNFAGLITVGGFLISFMLSKLGG